MSGLLQACENLFFFDTLCSPYRIISLLALLNQTQVVMFFYFADDISLFCPQCEVKPRPLCESCCNESRARLQLTALTGDLWMWGMPSTVFRMESWPKHGLIKPVSACRIPQSHIPFIIPVTVWLPGWMQLLFSPALS